MDKEELLEAFRERLHMELLLFKDSMLRKEKAEIYEGAYKIETYANLYEILVEKAEYIPAGFLREMAYQPSGIIEAFYREWLKKEDNSFMELKEYVENELEVLILEKTDEGKEGKYGKQHHTSAASRRDRVPHCHN